MSALACVLKQMGYFVIGSDVESYFYTEDNLNKQHIKYHVFNKDNINTFKLSVKDLSISVESARITKSLSIL